MKLILENFKKFVNEEELEGSSETDVIDDFLSAPVGKESPELTEGQIELWFTLQNAEMIASLAVGAAAVGILGITGLKALGAKALKFLEDRQINAREAARAAREKAEEEQAEAELVLLTDFLLEDPTFVAALDGLVTSGSRKDVIAFNKSVRGKIKELGSMITADPEALLKRLRKKADAGEIEQRVVSDFEEKVSSADPEQDVEALRKAEPASLSSRQRQKIKESKAMKITKARLRQIIKEEMDDVFRGVAAEVNPEDMIALRKLAAKSAEIDPKYQDFEKQALLPGMTRPDAPIAVNQDSLMAYIDNKLKDDPSLTFKDLANDPDVSEPLFQLVIAAAGQRGMPQDNYGARQLQKFVNALSDYMNKGK